MLSILTPALSCARYLVPLALVSSMAGLAQAQTPSRNLMPDGSHDMYFGLGAISRPYYDGATRQHASALPVLQMQWSNGVFVAGSMAGLHWSDTPGLEYGPLLSYEGKRTVNGQGSFAIGTGGGIDASLSSVGDVTVLNPDNKLSGLPEVPARLLGGGFFKLNLKPQWQWQNQLLAGAAASHNGVRLTSQLQYVYSRQHHAFSVTTGLNWVNRSYNQAYFGVPQGAFTLLSPYQPGAGVKDVFVELNWNAAVSSSWLLTSRLKLSSLQGSAARSPLVERRNAWQISTALAYRF